MPREPRKLAAPMHALNLEPGNLPDSTMEAILSDYKATRQMNSKGKIATMIFASRLARRQGLPFDISAGITTDGQGQVKGLGKGAVQAILADYGISRVLAEEGGRTSRGSLGNIRDYLAFLNGLEEQASDKIASIEAWWIDKAKEFFNAKPFVLRFETGKSLGYVMRDLLRQAKNRQEEGGGTMFVGAMLQHLVGAKLELALPEVKINHNGFSVADAASSRGGDFDIGNAALHVTTKVGEAVIRKCKANLDAGLHPVIITLHSMLPAADAFATDAGIADQLDVLDAEQFIVSNLYELGGFQSDQRRITVESLVDKYNTIIDKNETDPSLKISRS